MHLYKHLFHCLAVVLLCCLAALSAYILLVTYQGQVLHVSIPWFSIQQGASVRLFSADIYIDFVAAVMVGIVTWIGLLVYVYSIPYMQPEAGALRYFGLLLFFLVAMLGLVVADSLILLWMAWELVGWASYGLIGFWHDQPAAAAASTRAWLVNQLGSVSLLAGLLLLGNEADAWTWTGLVAWATTTNSTTGGLVGLLLMGGVLTKAAQFPLYYWLPRAMTAPTPASALLHAATVVSAGVYLFVRIAVLLPAAVLTGMAFLGSCTALLGACAAWPQHDLKKILAYSTISQLGLTVMAISIGASSAGMFHLVSHAIGKASLFLGAGAIARFLQLQGVASQAAQDIRKMGGMRHVLPQVFYPYSIAACSLVGIPGSAGFVSKEGIVASTFGWAQQQAQAGHYWGYVIPTLMLMATSVSVIYLGRQWVLVFWGSPRWMASTPPMPPKAAAIPLGMQLSMWSLALGSLGCWYSPWGGHFQDSWLWQGLGGKAASLPHAPAWPSLLALALGLGTVALQHKLTPLIAPHCQRVRALFLHGWYLEAAADAVAKQVASCSRLAAWIEQRVLGKLVQSVYVSYVVLGHVVGWVDHHVWRNVVVGLANTPQWLGRLHRWTQQGHWQHTLLWMLLGLGVLGGMLGWALR